MERLADTLKRQLSLTSKYESQRLAAELRADESLVEQQSLYPKLDSYVAETKRWRKLVSWGENLHVGVFERCCLEIVVCHFVSGYHFKINDNTFFSVETKV